jgi:hypothetical protein
MWDIIHQYGRFMLDAVTFVTLMALIFGVISDAEGHTGIMSIVRAEIPQEEIEYFDYTDFDAYEAECAKKKPEIIYDMPDIKCGEVDLSGGFAAYDNDRNEIDVKIISVTDPKGADIAAKDDGEYKLCDAGIYKVRVSAVDACGRKTVDEVSIPVNR